MADRRYYSERAGRGAAAAALNLDDLKRVFAALFGQLESEGYFQEYLGYECVDAGFVPGLVGTDLQAELSLTLRKPHLWPVHSTIAKWSEDDVFDMVEFLFDHISKPTQRWHHDYSSCGWHCSEFDRKAGRQEYREKVNRLLRAYDSGFELSEQGEVLAVAPTGFEPLLEASIPSADEENVGARVEAAIQKFRRHRASIEDRRDAVRDLADVLEFIRPSLKKALVSKDEQDLFNIANNFGIRHHNADQKLGYDKAIWLSWVFYYYLATIHAAVRLIERSPGLAPNPSLKSDAPGR
jgi:hypothetical protein